MFQFLQALLSPIVVASHTAAQVVAAFGAIDIPLGHWPTLLPTLFQNVSSPDVPLAPKVASLEVTTFHIRNLLHFIFILSIAAPGQALGYMCDNMDPSRVGKNLVDQILNTIVDGMRSDRPNEIRRAAVTAMCNSLEFTAENFEIPTERDMIMSVVCEATQCADLNARVKAFECIAAVANLYYDKLQHYMEALFRLTATAIQSDDQMVGQQAIEFWSTVCDEESEIVDILRENPDESIPFLKIVDQAAALLVPILWETLSKQDDSGGDDSWNIAMAGATCLDAIAQTIEDKVVDLVLPYIHANINSAEWRLKEASVMAFGSIVNGPSDVKLAPIVQAALPVLVRLLQDPNALVRDTTAWTIGRICEFQALAISPDMLPDLVGGLSAALEDSSSKVASQACFAVHNLAAACSQETEAPTNALSKFMPTVLQKLLAVTMRDDWETENLRATAYEAANMLVTNSARDMQPVVLRVLTEALGRLEATFTVQVDPQERMNLQSLLCGLVGVCVRKLPESDLNEALTDRLMQAILAVFNIKGAVAHEDAFMSIGFLIDKIQIRFCRYLDHFQVCLLNGLKNVEEHQVCTVAVGVVGDMCRALNGKVLPLCDAIVRSLLELLQSPTLNR